MRYFWMIIVAAIAGCASPDNKNDTYSPFHKLLIDSPAAQVWVDSRFDLLVESEGDRGKFWLYSDYQGKPDQEFVYVFAGHDEKMEWPPADDENTIELGSPIGTIYESYGGVEASTFGLPKLGKAFNFSYPACSYSRIWTHKGAADRYLVLIYMEGASCASVFGPQGSISSLSEMFIKNRARAVIKLKER